MKAYESSRKWAHSLRHASVTLDLEAGSNTEELNKKEREFINELREARPEDCIEIIKALYRLEGIENEDGELTPLGMLTGAIANGLFLYGVLKRDNRERK